MRTLLTLMLVLLLMTMLFGQGTRKDDIVARGYGGVTVIVCANDSTTALCGPPVPIYDNLALTIPKSNPFLTDAEGNFHFYAPPGLYKLELHAAFLTQPMVIPDYNLPPSGSAGVISFPSSITITSTINVTSPNSLVVCAPNVVITKGFNGDMITVTGSNSRVSGCTLEGAKATFTGKGVVVTGADNVIIDHNRIRNQATNAIYLDGATNFDVHDNTSDNNGSVPTVVTASGAGVTGGPGKVINNTFDSTTGVGADQHAFTATPVGAGAKLRDIVISSNTLIAGSGFCLEARTAPGATSVSNVVMSNNTCKLAVSPGDGCFSMSVVTGGAMSGNTCDVNGKTATFNFELAGSSGVSVTGNTLQGSGTATGGVVLNAAASNNTISGNTLLNMLGAGIELNNLSAVNADNNVITGNLITMSGAALNYGIWLQSNNAGATVNRTLVANNTIIGGGGATQQGIRLENNSGSVDSTQLASNTIYNLGQGIGLGGETNTQFGINKFVNVTSSTVGSIGAGSGVDLSLGLVKIDSLANSAIGIDLQPDNTSTQPRANVPWIRTNGAGAIIINPGTATQALYLAFDQGAGINFGNGTGGIVGGVTPTGLITGNAGLKAGSSGSTITQDLTCAGAITPVAVNATTCAEQTFTIAACSGLATTDTIFVKQSVANSTLAFPVGDWRVSGAGVIARTYCNPTAGALTPTPQTLTIWAMH